MSTRVIYSDDLPQGAGEPFRRLRVPYGDANPAGAQSGERLAPADREPRALQATSQIGERSVEQHERGRRVADDPQLVDAAEQPEQVRALLPERGRPLRHL